MMQFISLVVIEGVVTGVTADPRIGVGHSKVLHDSKRGFGGACFPKDIKAFNLFDPENA